MSLTTFNGPVRSVNGFFDGAISTRPGFAREADWRSLAEQTTTGLGVMTDVLFGPPAVSNTGILSVDAGGVVTALKAGPLEIVVSARALRTTNPGVGQIVVWSETRLGPASPWVQVGLTGSSALPDPGARFLFQDFTLVDVLLGQQLRVRWARDASGADDGVLSPFVPTGSLAGLNTVPSAAFVAYRLKNYPY